MAIFKGMLWRTLFFSLLTAFSCVHASAGSVYDEAVREVKEKKLVEDPYWETLLHFKQGWFSGYRSLIDDPLFFLAENGKRDKEAELLATVYRLLLEEGESDEFAQCRFPARTGWLTENISVLADNMPAVSCPHYEEITDRIKPSRVTLVFPFYNMGGPGSMFGHTMLRIEKEDSAPLLGHAVTYAADAEGAGAVKYVLFGVFGGFDGIYSVLPYSQKLNEYSYIEARDVWEYELAFTAEETVRIYNHVWEMSLVRSDYYFFDENCAYNLLFLLEAARPGLKLTDGFVTVLPIDTVRAVEEANLISGVNYRPSNVKRMQAMADVLSHREVATAKKIAKGKISAKDVHLLDINGEEKAALLDLAGELVRHYNMKNDPAEYRRLTISTLTERSKIHSKNDYSVSAPVPPENGHGSSRISAGGGYAYDSAYIQADYRISYHSLIDNSVGFMDTTTVAGDFRLRYYTSSERLGLDRATLLDIQNLTPYTALFRSPSWLVSAGMEDRSIYDESSFRVYYLNGGAGLTFDPSDSLRLWFSLSLETQYQEKYPHEFSAGAGIRGGTILNTGSLGKFVLDGRYLWYSDSSDHVEADVGIEYGFYPARNHSFTAGFRYSKLYDEDGTDFNLSYRFFF